MMIRARAARAAVVAAGFALAAVITATTPAAASAAAAQAHPTAVQTVPTFTHVPANGRVKCYGYYGTFLVGSDVMVVNWVHTSDECFGIATDRTIWHTWPNSGGWKKMGGNGLADDVVGVQNETANGSKGVMVWVAASNRYWIQNYAPPLGWTGEWTRFYP
jgi:hypothetical protein